MTYDVHDFLDFAPLAVRGRPHHSGWTEYDVETALAEHIKNTYPALTVYRQVNWGRHIPDLVCTYGSTLTIIEIKAVAAGDRALRQLSRYVDHAHALGWRAVYGVLAAPSFRIQTHPRPAWFSRWHLGIDVVRDG